MKMIAILESISAGIYEKLVVQQVCGKKTIPEENFGRSEMIASWGLLAAHVII